VKCRSYEAHHYAAFSSFLPLPPSYVQISSSAPRCETETIYDFPLVWETKFHTHTNQQADLRCSNMKQLLFILYQLQRLFSVH